MLRQSTFAVLAAAAAVGACLGDPVGVGSLVLVPDIGTDSAITGHPGEAFPQAIRIRAVGTNGGAGIAAARVEWIPSGVGARVQAASPQTDAGGYASAEWVLGTKAAERQGLRVRVSYGSHSAEVAYRATAVPYVVNAVHIKTSGPDTLRLGDSLRCHLEAVDPFGNVFPAPSPRFTSLDTTTIRIDSAGRARSLKRGTTMITATSAAAADTMPVNVVQVVQSIATAIDTFRFHALGQVASDSVKLVDDRGLPVRDSAPQVRLIDTTIVQLVRANPITLRSSANGATVVEIQAGSLVKNVLVAVSQQATSIQVAEPSLAFDALGDTVRLTATVVDSLGVPLSSPQVTFGSTDSSVVSVAAGGLVKSRGNGRALVLVHANTGVTDTVAASVSQTVSSVKIAADSMLFSALGATAPVRAVALDRLGFLVSGAVLTYRTGDTAVATVASDGTLRARSNGSTLVVARVGGDSALAGVRVAQRPVRIVPASDTIRMTAIGDTAVVVAKAVDSLGNPLSAPIQMSSVNDTTIAALLGPTTLLGRAKGTTVGTLTGAGLSTQVAVAVSPLPAKITAQLVATTPITSLFLDSLVPLTCRVFDRNGNLIDTMPRIAPSAAGRWTGDNCLSARAQHSGIDTVRVLAGGLETDVPIVLAVRPVVLAGPDNLQVDSLPSGTFQWAPTMRRNSQGQLEIYFAAYPVGAPNADALRSNLHRLVSSDGVHWVYDGVALQHNDTLCTPDGNGIENISIVPRADGPGWRMFFSAGGFTCYGWQVFSAVSTDERTWVKEQGVRLTNGGTVPPAASSAPPWPVGEGMATQQLASGQWRMLVGGYQQVQPSENKFQIVEWRSWDQLTWSYLGLVITTNSLPPAGQGTVYSPSITQIAPGLWRMVFNADNRFEPGWQGRIWSAVSTDQVSWQFEGELVSPSQGPLWYASIVDDRLVFILGSGDQRRLAIATVTMP
jgi:hypothetical protein